MFSLPEKRRISDQYSVDYVEIYVDDARSFIYVWSVPWENNGEIVHLVNKSDIPR